jgi:hypothetical protein
MTVEITDSACVTQVVMLKSYWSGPAKSPDAALDRSMVQENPSLNKMDRQGTDVRVCHIVICQSEPSSKDPGISMTLVEWFIPWKCASVAALLFCSVCPTDSAWDASDAKPGLCQEHRKTDVQGHGESTRHSCSESSERWLCTFQKEVTISVSVSHHSHHWSVPCQFLSLLKFSTIQSILP